MKFGAEPKKTAVLGALLVLGAYSFYTNVLSGPDLPASARNAPARSAAPVATGAAGVTPAQKATEQRMQQRKQIAGGRQSIGEFRPTMKLRPEDRPDPMKVDPTLRLDLLAKLQTVTVAGGSRSLFELGAAPPPAAAGPDPKIPVAGVKPKPPLGRLESAMLFPQPRPPDAPKTEAAKPPPPPIPLKFYGFSSPRSGGSRRAFFLEGEEIYVAGEGELVKRRYKVVQIRLNSVVVEDTEHKHQQTLPLEEPPAAS